PLRGGPAARVAARARLVLGCMWRLLAAAFGWWAGGRSAAGQVDLDPHQGLGRLGAFADRQSKGPRLLGRGRTEVELMDVEERAAAGGHPGWGVCGSEGGGARADERA